MKFFSILVLSFFYLLPGFSQEEDAEALNQDIERTARDFQNMAPVNMEAREMLPPNENTAPTADSGFGFLSFFNSKAMDQMKQVMINKFVKESPFKGMTNEQAKSFILAFVEGKPVGDYIKNSPRLLNFLSDVMIDNEALPKFFGILNKPEELKHYGYAMIAIFILSIIVNLIWNKNGGFFKRLFVKLLISLGATFVNLIVVYILFRENLAPMVRLAIKNF